MESFHKGHILLMEEVRSTCYKEAQFHCSRCIVHIMYLITGTVKCKLWGLITMLGNLLVHFVPAIDIPRRKPFDRVDHVLFFRSELAQILIQ